MTDSLGMILIKAGVVTPKDLIEAHKHGGTGPLASRLVAFGMVTEQDIAKAVATHLEMRTRPPLQPRVRPSLRPVRPPQKPVRYH